MTRPAQMSERLLSIADISRHFSLPESTTRYYCKRFAAFIPGVGDGRRRRYRQETLEVISAVLEQMQKSRTAAAVEDALQERFPRNALTLSQSAHVQHSEPENHMTAFLPASALQLLERQTMAMESISHVIRLLVERFPAPAAPVESDSKLREDMETLRMLLHASEKTQQADLEQLRRWMARVIQTRSISPPLQPETAQAV